MKQIIELKEPKERIQGINIISEGKNFESYAGWLFAKALEVRKYNQDSKYSFRNEVKILYQIIE